MNGFQRGNSRPRWHGPRPQAPSSRRPMLDMKRQKYFRFDLDDLLVSFELGDNKTTVAATILNKATSHSMEEALDYIERVTEGGTLNKEQSARLKALLQRYSKWR